MHIIVLAKQVPDIERVQFDKDTHWVDRKSTDSEINPFDLNAIEAAQQMKEKLGATVTVISMGPPSAEAVLRECIARNADRGILVTDEKLKGSDTLATSRALAGAVKKVGDFDLILCGEKTVDGDSSQIGPEVAERLNIPHMAFVSEIADVGEDKINVTVETASGSLRAESPFPVLVTCTKELNTPRLPSLKDKMRARKTETEKWSAADVAEESKVGAAGSATEVTAIEVPPEKKRKSISIKGENAARELVAALDKEGLLKG